MRADAASNASCGFHGFNRQHAALHAVEMELAIGLEAGTGFMHCY